MEKRTDTANTADDACPFCAAGADPMTCSICNGSDYGPAFEAEVAKKVAEGTIKVTRTPIIGTNCVLFRAYELSAAGYFGPHSFLFTIDGKVHGELPSRALPAEIAALPVGPHRWGECDAFRAANEREAYAAILAAYPEAAGGSRRMGQIEIWT